MYAREIVEKRIEIAERVLGFSLEYHTPSEIDSFNEQLEHRYEDAYATARRASQGSNEPQKPFQTSIIKALADPTGTPLSSEEVRFIQNERALSMCDTRYWLGNFYKIKTQDQGTIRFVMRKAQEVLFNAIAEFEKRGAPKEFIAPKARQHGVTTEAVGLILHETIYDEGVNSVAASADDDKTEQMAKMYFESYDLLPWWNRPTYSRRVQSNAGLFEFGGLRSTLNFQTGSQASGISRGSTVRSYHLSEVASYTNPAQQIDASLFKAVHAHPNVLGLLESTAEGNSGWFYDSYWFAKAERESGRSRLQALFLPWWLGTDQYPTKTWIRMRSVPSGWQPTPETWAMIEQAKAYLRSNPVLDKVVGANWEMPREQAWFWECNFLEHRAKGIEKLWRQEMPCDDTEAFQSSYDNVFGRETVAESFRTRETAYHAFAIIGQSIEERHEPPAEDVDESSNVVQVRFLNRLKDVAYRWELIPTLWKEPFRALEDIRSDDDEYLSRLFVYDEPQIGYDYSMAIRTGNGIGSGQTAIAVARRGRTPQEPDIQVAEFRSREVSHIEAYAWGMAIGAYYSKHMGDTGTRKEQPYLAIEQVQSSGDTTQFQMHRMGYRRFHRMKRYDSDPKVIKNSNLNKLGWYSVGWATPMYTDSFVVWVRNGWYKVNSAYTIWEMDHWEAHETTSGKQRYIASETSSDSGLLANAMAAFCVNDMRPMAERTMKRCYDGTGAAPKLDITPTRIGTVFPISGRYNQFHETDLFRGR